MIELKKGNFFDYEADIRINTVNCVGVMGAGVALQFKNMYPKMFLEYKEMCSRNNLRPGNLHIWKSDDIFNPITIINFPTKDDWRKPSEYSYIEDGLESLNNFLKTEEYKTITLPALGCGHGGLEWDIVKPMIYEKLNHLPVKILLFEPESSKNIPLNDAEALSKKNVHQLEPSDKEFPQKLKGKTSRAFFYTGNINLLNDDLKIINIISSKYPTEKEKSVLFEILSEIKEYKSVAILIRGDKSYELDIVKFSLEQQIKIIINPSKGLLNFNLRKDIHPFLNNENHLIYNSIKNQNDNWSIANFTSNLKESFIIADIVLYNISELSEMLKSIKLSGESSQRYYINYFNNDTVLHDIGANLLKIGRNKEGKPNVFKILNFMHS